ncbi:MAG: hypothetical protein Tsb005_15080 [Gammaproteobacteria bacterium]
MIEKLFSYGTLQIENVQLANFGRKLVAYSDALVGYKIRECLITDPKVISTSGKAVHPIACFTGNPEDVVPGTTFDISYEELQQADKYEVDDYKRVRCRLQSGEQAWVYVQSGLNIDPQHLQQGSIKLEIFQDSHIPMLCERAQDARIWEHHRITFNNPAIFTSIIIEKAKKAISNKTRYMFVIYYQNELIGSTSYYDVNLNHLKMHIGYTWLHSDYWGKGINNIVKRLMLAYAFEQLQFKRVAFCIDAENLRSRNAIEKLRIPFEGILKNHQIRADGSSRDSALYAITDKGWAASLGSEMRFSENNI